MLALVVSAQDPAAARVVLLFDNPIWYVLYPVILVFALKLL
jgi:hypothetical protein